MTPDKPTPSALNCHPACAIVPEMTEQEYLELVEDIREHGQRHAIIVDEDGLILDGRHRARALEELGRPPQTIPFHGDEEAKLALIISENVKRRHWSTKQRAAVAAELAEHLAEAAKQRQLAGKPVDPKDKGTAVAQAAKQVGGVSARSVAYARKRMREAPEAHALAKAGKLPKAKPATIKTPRAGGKGAYAHAHRQGGVRAEPARRARRGGRVHARGGAALAGRAPRRRQEDRGHGRVGRGPGRQPRARRQAGCGRVCVGRAGGRQEAARGGLARSRRGRPEAAEGGHRGDRHRAGAAGGGAAPHRREGRALGRVPARVRPPPQGPGARGARGDRGRARRRRGGVEAAARARQGRQARARAGALPKTREEMLARKAA